MAVMEILTKNILNTTTMVLVDSATNMVKYLFDGNKILTYQSDGYSSDTSTIISVEFDTLEVITNVLLQNHNFKQFRVFYDSVTANSLYTATTNSETSTYISFGSVTVNSIQLQIDSCQTSDTEKSIGEFIINELQFVFERNPEISNYNPLVDRKQIIHEMADGGVTLHNIQDKYRVKMKFDFITENFYNDLLSLYSSGIPFCYVPFPTTSSWLGQAYEMVWSGNFDFKYATNVRSIGYKGTILFQETSSA